MVKLLGASCVKVEDEEQRKIKGKVMLVKKNVLGVTDVGASILDRLYEIFGKGVSFTLISATHSAHARGKGKLGKESYLKDWISKFTSLAAEEEVTFDMNFEWHESLGIPGAISINNNHHSQFFLKAVTLNVPGHGKVHFVCNSWIYPAHRYNTHRIFFSNKAYLPGETPEPLRSYREEALISLRGKGSGMLKEWDRVYDYDYYNDLGNPDKGQDYARPVLGGSKEYPYPRRGRTGRPTNRTDPTTESRLPLLSLDIYVPSDEKFSEVKFSDFIAYALKSLGQVIVPEIKALFDKTINEFDSFQDVINLYEGGIKLPDGETLDKIRKRIPFEFLRELLRSDGERFLKFPLPDVIKDDKTAWRTDEEFGREMLAGVNPVVIRQLLEFPPKSRLDRRIYANQDSIIMKDHIEKNMNGLTVDQAIKNNKMFILDHHDPLMPFLRRINTTATKTYASRTLLLLQDDGTLKPLAIELSLPHEDGDAHGSVSDVYTPSPFDHGVESSIWQLAKAYAAVNDSGYHQLISHWTHTHAVIEPIVIATNRQLSVMHPIHKLLKPHFRDTMHINAIARQLLINAGGLFENTVFQGRYAFEISSSIYRTWNFTEQALPQDLIKRGMAVPDSSQPYGLRLMIEDYPYAVDGLEIWSAIEAWVKEYCSLYYSTDDKIREDTELQSWWKEVREEGHGDLQHEPWWPKLHTLHELVHSCTTIIWIASALHAAVNFGQYPYAGYMPNRPTVSRRFMPKRGTSDFAELETNPDAVFLKTVTSQLQTLLGISLIELLSRHSVDEIYLGQNDTPEWTADDPAKEAFKKFGETLLEIETRIMERNEDSGLKNRFGPVKMAYTLLYPDTSNTGEMSGLTGKGIPNSISM